MSFFPSTRRPENDFPPAVEPTAEEKAMLAAWRKRYMEKQRELGLMCMSCEIEKGDRQAEIIDGQCPVCRATGFPLYSARQEVLRSE